MELVIRTAARPDAALLQVYDRVAAAGFCGPYGEPPISFLGPSCTSARTTRRKARWQL